MRRLFSIQSRSSTSSFSLSHRKEARAALASPNEVSILVFLVDGIPGSIARLLILSIRTRPTSARNYGETRLKQTDDRITCAGNAEFALDQTLGGWISGEVRVLAEGNGDGTFNVAGRMINPPPSTVEVLYRQVFCGRSLGTHKSSSRHPTPSRLHVLSASSLCICHKSS